VVEALCMQVSAASHNRFLYAEAMTGSGRGCVETLLLFGLRWSLPGADGVSVAMAGGRSRGRVPRKRNKRPQAPGSLIAFMVLAIPSRLMTRLRL
jgi:hypothetical protein